MIDSLVVETVVFCGDFTAGFQAQEFLVGPVKTDRAGFFGFLDTVDDAAVAKALLDEAGWTVGSDGIRVKDGQRLRIKYQTTTGNKLREDSQVLIVENMKAIGIEFYIENQPSSLLIGSWAANSPRKKGNYDIIMYTTNASIDPHSQMYNYFDSKSIPSPDNQGGINYSRWNDPETDKLIEQAGSIPDWPQRKDLYCKAAARVVDGARINRRERRRVARDVQHLLRGEVKQPFGHARPKPRPGRVRHHDVRMEFQVRDAATHDLDSAAAGAVQHIVVELYTAHRVGRGIVGREQNRLDRVDCLRIIPKSLSNPFRVDLVYRQIGVP